MNVGLELLDGPLLFFDDRFDQIADGDHADHPAAFDHRQMTDALVRHEDHALGQCVVRRNRMHR